MLLADDAPVRAYVEAEDPELRRAGCKLAVGALDDLGRLEAAMEQVHTVVHLAGGPEPPPGRSVEWVNEELTDVAVRAAVGADVARFIAPSEAGAVAEARSAYLRSVRRAEEIVRASGLQHAVLRCAPVLGPSTPLGRALRTQAATRGPVALLPGTQRLNPLWVGDLARALLLADAREATVGGTWELGGPDVVTLVQLVSRAAGRPAQPKRSMPGLPRALREAYAEDRVAGSRAFLSQFPMALTPLDRALAGTLA